VKPLSANQAYKGVKYKTSKYKEYDMELSYKLPPSIDLPDSELYEIIFEFGLSSKNADGDNCIKQTQDIISRKYGFNDKKIRRWVVDAIDVKKGEEYVKFAINKLER